MRLEVIKIVIRLFDLILNWEKKSSLIKWIEIENGIMILKFDINTPLTLSSSSSICNMFFFGLGKRKIKHLIISAQTYYWFYHNGIHRNRLILRLEKRNYFH